MFFNGVFGRLLKIMLLLVVCMLGFVLTSCSQEPQLPKDAQDALTDYWQSLPSASTIEHEIVRAWPGDTSNDDFYFPEIERELWCVEAEISSAEDPDLVGEEMVWIVSRYNEEAGWSAYLLAAMSSMWAYEACQQTGFLD